MKLIYIDSARLPTEKAHGYQTCKMCEEFARAGIEVELLIPNRSNQIKQDIFSYYGLQKNFKVKKLFCPNLVWLERPGFILQTFIFLIFSRFYLFTQKYDILYCRDKLMGLLLKDFVLEVHVLPEKIGFFYKRLWKKARLLVVLNDFLKQRLVKTGVSEKKILISPDAVDLKKFDIDLDKDEARRKLQLPLDKKIVLYAGHLYRWKGASVLLEAARNFQFPVSNFQKILFVFVGGMAEDIKIFKSQISNYELQNAMIVGHRPPQEIPVWLKAADVLVLTGTAKSDISRYYTSPLKMFEYMASGKPIVAPRLESFLGVLNGENSFLVEPDNPEALAQGIKKLLSDEILSQKISSKARLDVKNYTWEKRAERILGFVRN